MGGSVGHRAGLYAKARKKPYAPAMDQIFNTQPTLMNYTD
jgi:hypothetical protein